jgi:hypothetical protein
MPLRREESPTGDVWIRPPFRPEDYMAPVKALRLFERWRGDAEDSDTILTMRGTPFANYVEVGREVRGGKTWILLLEASREFAVEVEQSRSGFGEVVAVPPRRAYDMARARDALRSFAVKAQE